MKAMNNEYLKIRQICGDVDQRIAACRTKNIAEMLKSQLCHELDQACESEMIKNLLSAHIDSIITETFNSNGQNKFLEA